MQRYTYDPAGQLIEVIDDASGEKLETYVYDKAGNMLEKVVAGEKTVMTYNAANELASRTVTPADPNRNSKLENQKYTYDQAGRLLGYEGGSRSTYGWLDKVTALKIPDGQTVTYRYWPDGQLAVKEVESRAESAKDAEGKFVPVSNSPSRPLRPLRETKEHFLWDGLALLRRNDTLYVIEPHPSGGVPIASYPADDPSRITYHLNDMLGTTLATIDGGSIQYAQLTTFGQPLRATSVPATSPATPQLPTGPNPATNAPPALQTLNTP